MFSATSKKHLTDYLDTLVNSGLLNKHSKGYSLAGPYILHHGEYERYDLRPTRYGKEWGVKRINYYYDGTLHAPEDGRVEVCLMEVDPDVGVDRVDVRYLTTY